MKKKEEIKNYNDSYNLLKDMREFKRIYEQSEEDCRRFFGDGKTMQRGRQMKNNLEFVAIVLIPVMMKKIDKQLQDYRSENADVL